LTSLEVSKTYKATATTSKSKTKATFFAISKAATTFFSSF